MSPPVARPHDHAVVIGIRRYVDTAAGWVSELRGSDNDAAAVAAWLRDSNGGGLAHDNVRVLCSADAPDPEVARKLITIAARSCQVTMTLSQVAQIVITYEGLPLELKEGVAVR